MTLIAQLIHRIAFALTTFVLVGCVSQTAIATSKTAFSFGLIGDQQYNAAEEKQFAAMLLAIDREPLDFVVHLGDFKAGGFSPCTDSLFSSRFTELNQSKHPLIYTPGDNEWVDCRRPSNGAMDPLERLDKLRELFFREPKSLGRSSMSLTSQASSFSSDSSSARYRENTMWVHRGVVFVTLNIQGSNDNVGFDVNSDNEQRARVRANTQWLNTAIDRARSADVLGLAVISHANPGFEESPIVVAKSPYMTFLRHFETEAVALGKPVIFAHGDSHRHRVDQPYRSPIDKRKIDNVIRVEGYGSPQVNWVRVTVDPGSAHLFKVSSGNFLRFD
jgi:hypothetical protein